MHKEQSVLTKELKDWEITNLIQKRNAPIRLKHKEERKTVSAPEEEGKIMQNRIQNSNSDFNFDFPSNFGPGTKERMEHLRQMEKHLFPNENKELKKQKNRIKAYKRSKEGNSNSRGSVPHNFTGNRIRVNQNDVNIDKYLAEIRGEIDNNDIPFLPEKHANRVRGLDEQDDIFHPMLGDALGNHIDATPAPIIMDNVPSNLLPSTQADSDEYVAPSKDPAKELREEIRRNKEAKARLRELQKKADLQKARANAPLKKYYNKNTGESNQSQAYSNRRMKF